MQPRCTYSATFAWHSSAVPDAVIICTIVVGDELGGGLHLFGGRRPGEHLGDLLQQRLGDAGSLHDVGLLAEVLGDEQAGGVERRCPVLVERAHDELGAVEVGRPSARPRCAPRSRWSIAMSL